MSIVIVDPVSTGGALAAEYYERGYQLICVWSNEVGDIKSHVPDCAKAIKWLATVDQMEEPETSVLAAKINSLIETELVACVVGAETGVVTADALSAELGLRSNGVNEKRRNKSWQQKTVASAGLRATREASGTALSDVETFLETETYPIIVKPTESAGSDGVKKCHSREEAEAHFKLLMKAQRRIGSAIKGAAVICQEFLAGDEYVVDTVSRDGVHKCVCIWKYIKFPLNGADNVFYGQRLMTIDSEPHLAQMVNYVFNVITALGIVNGAVHNEVKYNGTTEAGRARGAVMIESNCRLHGAEGSWKPVAERCLGYSQVSTILDAYDPNPDKFEALPKAPSKALAYGAQVGVRSVVEGTISMIKEDKVARIRLVNSYDSESLDWANQLAVGQKIAKTIDILTLCGQIQLVHKDKETLEADLAKVQEIIDDGLFVVGSNAAKPRRRKVTGDLHISPPVAESWASRFDPSGMLFGYGLAFAAGAVAAFGAPMLLSVARTKRA